MDCGLECNYIQIKYKDYFTHFSPESLKSMVILGQVNQNIFQIKIGKQIYYLKHIDSSVPIYEIYMKDDMNIIHGLFRCESGGNYALITSKLPKLSYDDPIRDEVIEIENIPEIITIKNGNQIEYTGFPTDQNYTSENLLNKVTKFKIENLNDYSVEVKLTREQRRMLYCQRKLTFEDKKFINFYTRTGDNYINTSLRFGLDAEKAKKIYIEGANKIPSDKKISKILKRAKKSIIIFDDIFSNVHKTYRSETPTYLLRGMKLDNLIFEFNKKILYKNFVSTTEYLYTAASFTNTNYSKVIPNFRDKCCILLLEIEPGVPILGTEFSTSFEGEDEYILPRNLYFQLTGISQLNTPNNSNYTLLHVRVTKN